jgi:undecaprenyl-diphosphatase
MTTRLIWGIAGLLSIATPLTAFAAGPGVLPGDVRIAETLHTVLPWWLDAPLAFANLLGLAPVAMVVTAFLAICLIARGWFSDAALVASAGLAWAGNATLKILVESPRPTADLVRISEHADGFGFPSGHVMGLTVLLGALLVVVSRRVMSRPARLLAQLALLTTIALTGLARVAVGAHWPSDILGGYLWGSAFLLVVLLLMNTIRMVGRRSMPTVTSRTQYSTTSRAS